MSRSGSPGAPAASLPWRRGTGCVIVRVRLTPKSSADAVVGVEETADGPAFKARVRALPSEGEANLAAARLFADWLGVAKGSVSLAAGGKSRSKSLAIAGDPDWIEARLAELTAKLRSSA